MFGEMQEGRFLRLWSDEDPLASAPGSAVEEVPELLVWGGCLGAFASTDAVKKPCFSGSTPNPAAVPWKGEHKSGCASAIAAFRRETASVTWHQPDAFGN